MGKTRATIRLKQKVQGKKSHNKSEDLTRLTEQYNAFTNRLQGLVSVRARTLVLYGRAISQSNLLQHEEYDECVLRFIVLGGHILLTIFHFLQSPNEIIYGVSIDRSIIMIMMY